MSDQQPQFEAPQGYEPYSSPSPYAAGAQTPYSQPSAGQPAAPQAATPYATPTYAQPQPSQPNYGYQSYGQQPSAPMAPYQQPSYGYSGYQVTEHPQSQTVFILGIIGIFTGITSFIAWYLGGQAKKEIEGGAPYLWGGNLKTGYTLGKVFGIISIAVWALVILFYLLLFLSIAANF